jgi:hypothetical protein
MGTEVTMTKSQFETVMKMLSFEKKGDLEKYCRSVVINSDDFVALILACEQSGNPFLHEITFQDRLPEHLVPTDDEIATLKGTPAGTLLAGDAKKAVTKMAQMFEERRYLVGHMFYLQGFSRWHFFCFDQRDTDARGNHWKNGAHIHFVNWLWPSNDPKRIWSDFVTEEQRPGGAIHLRFSEN